MMLANEHITVGVRMRPLVSREIKNKETCAWEVDEENNVIRQKQRKISRSKSRNASKGELLEFPFNKAFGADACTKQVYDGVMKNLILSAMEGINGTIFAYGQTSSGKTHTIKGFGDELGIIALSINEVFKSIRETPDREFLLRVSYLEIYNETIRDLLNDEKIDLKIKESKTRGVFVQGAREGIVTSVSEVLQMMNAGERRRHYGKTKMNDLSSRSHTILTLTIESKALAPEAGDGRRNKVRVSTLHFVDLAGSERMVQAGTKGKRAKEGMHINKSLLFLGVVISKLSEGEKYVPFRDSKLTRILQSSLGGNSRTAVIVNVSPALSNIDHTIGTLRFGSRAIKIQNHAHVNEVSSESAMLNQHYSKIVNMQGRLSHLEEKETEEDEEALVQNTVELKADLELQLTHLRNLVLKNTSPSIASEQVVNESGDPVQVKRHRRPKSMGVFSNGKPLFTPSNMAANEVSATTNLGNDEFREHQNVQLQKTNKELDDLLNELSTENGVLLNQLAEGEHEQEALSDIITEVQQERDELSAELEDAQVEIAQFKGEGLDKLNIEQLASMQATLLHTLTAVMRQQTVQKLDAEVQAALALATQQANASEEPVIAETEEKAEAPEDSDQDIEDMSTEHKELTQVIAPMLDDHGEYGSYEEFSKALDAKLKQVADDDVDEDGDEPMASDLEVDDVSSASEAEEEEQEDIAADEPEIIVVRPSTIDPKPNMALRPKNTNVVHTPSILSGINSIKARSHSMKHNTMKAVEPFNSIKMLRPEPSASNMLLSTPNKKLVPHKSAPLTSERAKTASKTSLSSFFV